MLLSEGTRHVIAKHIVPAVRRNIFIAWFSSEINYVAATISYALLLRAAGDSGSNKFFIHSNENFEILNHSIS